MQIMAKAIATIAIPEPSTSKRLFRGDASVWPIIRSMRCRKCDFDEVAPTTKACGEAFAREAPTATSIKVLI